MASAVAFLAEGVDRNLLSRIGTLVGGEVAFLAEGVDRNLPPFLVVL